MYRFAASIAIAFTTAFVGISWAMHGFPMQFSRSPIAQLQPSPEVRTFGDTRETEDDRKLKEAIAQAEKAVDPALDQLRLDTLQAANAYALSPCDPTMKANLVAALTAYAKAWQRVLNCTGPRMFCGEENLRRAAATFSTSLDKRIKVALDKAFEQQGIVKADFPSSVQLEVLQFGGPNLWSAVSPVCARLAYQRGLRR